MEITLNNCQRIAFDQVLTTVHASLGKYFFLMVQEDLERTFSTIVCFFTCVGRDTLLWHVYLLALQHCDYLLGAVIKLAKLIIWDEAP